ncbi:MAG: bifunctional 4-hydroxy-2-oxoglutarate aldolase/2-dehydro-3-deoxy-phosphogluconate aldolase [Phycisphaerae bacterium]|jgi:2-dehydro-3-deoxyphosphogluconate aldolase/(4S)-4-hydroxy-2-oxoglutarate aldolase|nr:bifunctional 4-hydroxy-2-oxoglutarate aldolase/2-dehydro-3-deoxy-phosphogluconate aldolase [Phycisphaerae bacterium]
MSEMTDKLGQLKLIPVVVIENAADAAPLGQALIDGGLPCAEVTFRTAAAPEAISAMSKLDGLLLGAGTVLTVDQAKQAVDCGAKFIVTPGFNPKVVGYCVENDISITPGVCTPTQIEAALDFGLNVVKFFPAEAFGGLKTLKAISGPYPMMKFVPTGGINAANIGSYLAFEKVLACGGSWIVKKDLIAANDFAEITRLTQEAMAAIA